MIHLIHSSESETRFGGDTLLGETKEHWKELCRQVIVEQDPHRFTTTIRELIQALDENEHASRPITKEITSPVMASDSSA
jgi:hypothetical protein